MASGKLGNIGLEVSHAFGSLAAGSFRDAAFFGDENGQCLITPVGRHAAARHTESGEVSFLLAHSKVEAVTACTVSRDKNLLAVCERCIQPITCQISVYDLRKDLQGAAPIKVVEPLGRSSARAVSVTFSGDSPSQYITVIYAGTEVSIVVLDWQESRVVVRQVFQTPLDRVRFAPNDSTIMSVSGGHRMRLLRLQNAASKTREAQLKLMPAFGGLNEDALRFTDHSWSEPSDGTIVACTAEGAIFVLDSEGMNVMITLDPAFHEESGLGQTTMPSTIHCFQQGFLVGGGEGLVAIWEKVDTPLGDEGANGLDFGYKHARTVKVLETDAAVSSIDTSGSEEYVVFSFRNGDVGYLQTAMLYSAPADELECSLVNGGFHGGAIVSLDMATQRPLVATACKKDCSVRIWNYATRNCELRWQFPGDPPSGVAIHPLGYFVAVSFQEKLGFFHVLLRELKLYREVVLPNCKLLRYSHGGHLLATAQGNAVVVFCSKSFSRLVTLEGHGAKVVALCFDPSDSALMSCASDGSIVEWSTNSWLKVHEQAPKPTIPREYLSATMWEDGNAMCSASHGSKCYIQNMTHCDVELEQEVQDKCKITSLCRHPSGALFWGTSNGFIWGYTAAAAQTADGKVVLRPQAEQGIHAGPCNHLCLSADGRTLLTAGDDGSIFVIGVTGVAGGDGGAADKAQRQRMLSAADTVLISRKEIQQTNEELRMLRAENGALGTQLGQEATRLEEECRQKVFEARQKDQAEIHELRRRSKALEQATLAKERESQRISKEMKDSHNQAAEQLDNLYDRKLEHEQDRYVPLETNHSELGEQIKEVKESSTRLFFDEEHRFKEELNRIMAEKDLEIQKHKDLIAFTQHRFEAMLDQESKEYDIEITEAKTVSHQDVVAQKLIEVKLRREQEALLKGLEMMEKDRERAEKDQHDAAGSIADVRLKCEELSRTVSSLREEKAERASTLADKEKKIDSYQVKVNKLKKFKHVLDQDLLEVTESLQPKDHMIAQLNDHLKELEVEFEKQLIDQRSIEAAIEQKKQQIDVHTSDAQRLREVIKDKDRIVARFREDVHGLVKGNEDLKKWPQEIRRMYHTHVCGQSNQEDRLPLEDMQQKMRFAERRVTSLAAGSRQMKATCKADMQRRAAESALLVGELNQLRVDKMQLQQSAKSLRVKLDRLERERVGDQLHQKMLSVGDVGDEQKLLDYNDTRRPSLPPDADSSDAVAPAVEMPRIPSGGSLPGPRQQVRSAGSDHGVGATRKPAAKARLAGLSSSSAAQKQKANMGNMSAEDELRLESLQSAAATTRKKLEMHKTENTQLRETMETLLKERKRGVVGSEGNQRRRGSAYP